MDRKLNNLIISGKFNVLCCFQKATLFLCILLVSTFSSYSQDEGVKPPIITEYKGDTTFANFNTLRYDIAKAQIISLKTNGALLVRLKTNANTINRLKSAGNSDLATQIERETFIKNKIIILSYLQEFKFFLFRFF
jgi:subtilase family serine protease